MPSKYWIDRQNRMMDRAEISEQAYLRSLASFYRSTQFELEAIINEMYAKYGKDGKLTFQQLATIDEKRRISRLEAMKIDIANKISKLTHNTQSRLKKQMKADYTDSFLKTKFNLQTYLGYGASFDLPPTKQINRVLDARWVDEKNYSERIWDNRTKLVQNLFDAVGQTIARGLSAQQCADMIQKEMNSSYSSAIRLARTEINHICNEAAADAYKDEGIEYYQFLATLDERTSEICQELDGQIFPISEKQVGVNCPPMHPNCRSTIVPVINIDKSQSKYSVTHIDEDGDKTFETKKGRIDSQIRVSKVDGKYKYVPGDITYKEWERVYIEEKAAKDIEDEIARLKQISESEHRQMYVTSENEPYNRVKVDETLVTLVADQMLVKYDKVEAGITEDMLNTSLKVGLPTEGIRYRLKEDDSLARKISQDYANNEGKKSITDIAKNLGDIERYTFILGEKNFVSDMGDIRKELEDKGYVFGRIKNTFTSDKDTDYKGMNCIIFKNGLPVEVQFHTQASFDAKQLNHQYYECIRTNKDLENNPLTPEKRAEYLEKQAENNRLITRPDKISEVENLNPNTKVNELRKLLNIEDPFEDLDV